MVDEIDGLTLAACTQCRTVFVVIPMDERGQGGLLHECGGWGIVDPENERCKRCETPWDNVPIVALQVGGWKHYGCWITSLDEAAEMDRRMNA